MARSQVAGARVRLSFVAMLSPKRSLFLAFVSLGCGGGGVSGTSQSGQSGDQQIAADGGATDGASSDSRDETPLAAPDAGPEHRDAGGAQPAAATDAPPAPEGPAAFFRTDVVHRIDITIEPAMWQAYMADHTSYGPRADPVWFRADFRIDGTALTDVAFHTFGHGSRVEQKQKPNLSLDINRNVPGQSLAGVTRMRIKNNGQDVTGLRQVLVYEGMRAAGLMAPRTAFATLQVNGEAWGFYTVEEHFNKDFVRERTGNDDGPAYEAYDCRGFVQPEEEGGCARIVNFYAREFNASTGRGEDLVALCEAMNGPPERFMASVGALVHMPEWIGHIAVDTALAGDNDGYSTSGSNFRLYHDTAMNKLRLVVLGPDDTFVPDRLPEPDPLRPRPNSRCVDPTSRYRDIFLERLLATPEGLALYRQAVRELRTNVMAGPALKQRVDALWAVVGGHVLADSRNAPHMEPDERLAEIKRYIDLRWAALEAAGL
jgi:hypothetical protein